jgi:glycosyltransferase involved in cell wall biosynthesis
MTLVPKICILTETYYPVVGGGETQARSLAESLADEGFSVVVLTRRSHPNLARSERFGSVTVRRLPPTGYQHYKKWGLLTTSFPALIRLRQQYDVLFVSGFRVVGMTAVLVSKLFGKACVLKADSLGEMSGDFFSAGLARVGLSPSSPPLRPFLWLRNRILRRADAFVAISSAVATELRANGVKPSAIRMIPNSVDVHRFSAVAPQERAALRRTLGLPSGDKIVVYTGRLVSYKGLPLLLRVWQDISAKHHDVRLLLVGSGGLDIHNCEAELKAYVGANGLEGSVRFTGSVDNVHEYLQASDIFVFPTEREAFGISLIEAMACGLPVISTSVGGVKDILQHRRNGLVVEPGDSRPLYDALDALMTDSALSTRLAQSAWRTVQERYSDPTVIPKYVELLRDVRNLRERDCMPARQGSPESV